MEFTNMTGIEWPAGRSMGVPLRRDLTTLGLDVKRVPTMLNLCLDCVVEYMKEFNRLLEERRNAGASAKQDASSRSS